MIGKITGRIDHLGEGTVLIETASGLGYEIQCSSTTLAALPRPGSAATLYTELVVREDLMQLIGFRDPLERAWYRLLTSVTGVGAKAALGLLGTLGTSGLGRAIALGDAPAIRAAPGVGPKLATRIATELKGRAPDMMAMGERRGTPSVGDTRSDAGAERAAPPPVWSADERLPPLTPTPIPAAEPAPTPEPAPRPSLASEAEIAQALSALSNLGYARGEAAEAVARSADEGARSMPELIRGALRGLDRPDDK